MRRVAPGVLLPKKNSSQILVKAVSIHQKLQDIDAAQDDSDAYAELMKEAIDELTVIRTALLKSMGRRP